MLVFDGGSFPLPPPSNPSETSTFACFRGRWLFSAATTFHRPSKMSTFACFRGQWLFTTTTTFQCPRKRARMLVFEGVHHHHLPPPSYMPVFKGGGCSPLPPPSTTFENEAYPRFQGSISFINYIHIYVFYFIMYLIYLHINFTFDFIMKTTTEPQVKVGESTVGTHHCSEFLLGPSRIRTHG